MTTALSARIVRRLCVPCTPSELSATLDVPVPTMRAMLYQLQRYERVRRMDRRVVGASGLPEYLWEANADPDELHELAILDCYDRWLEGEAKWPEVVALLTARSPAQVRKMEVAKGLT